MNMKYSCPALSDAFIFGLGSGTLPLLLAIRADYFGRKTFATITVAMMMASGSIGGLTSFMVSLSGWLADVSRSFEFVFLLSMLLGLVAAGVFFLARPPKKRGMNQAESQKGGSPAPEN